MKKKQPIVTEKKLGRERASGQAWKEDRIIEIDPRQNAYEFLDTLLHEWIHIEFPDWTERTVAAKSKKLSKFLWKHKCRIIK
jgi:hypothetical protein